MNKRNPYNRQIRKACVITVFFVISPGIVFVLFCVLCSCFRLLYLHYALSVARGGIIPGRISKYLFSRCFPVAVASVSPTGGQWRASRERWRWRASRPSVAVASVSRAVASVSRAVASVSRAVAVASVSRAVGERWLQTIIIALDGADCNARIISATGDTVISGTYNPACQSVRSLGPAGASQSAPSRAKAS